MSTSPVPDGVVAAVKGSVIPAKDRELSLAIRQKEYFKQEVLPSDKVEAHIITLNRSNYDLVDDVLYTYTWSKIKLRIVPPIAEREKFWNEAYCGVFGGHL